MAKTSSIEGSVPIGSKYFKNTRPQTDAMGGGPVGAPGGSTDFDESTGLYRSTGTPYPPEPTTGDFGPGGNIFDPSTVLPLFNPPGRFPSSYAPISRLTRPPQGGPTGQFIFPPVTPGNTAPPPGGTTPPPGGGTPPPGNMQPLPPAPSVPSIPPIDTSPSPGETGPGAMGAPPGMTGVSMNPNAMQSISSFLGSRIGRMAIAAIPLPVIPYIVSQIVQSEINKNLHAPIDTEDIDPNTLTDITDAIDAVNNMDAIDMGIGMTSEGGGSGVGDSSGTPGGGGAGVGGSAGGDSTGEYRKGGIVKNISKRKGGAEPITAHQGEFVVNPRATGANLPLLQKMNQMIPPGMPRGVKKVSSSNKPMFAKRK